MKRGLWMLKPLQVGHRLRKLCSFKHGLHFMTKNPKGEAKVYEEFFPGLESQPRNWQCMTCWISELLWTSDPCLTSVFVSLVHRSSYRQGLQIRPEELHLLLDLIFMRMFWISRWYCNGLKLFRSVWKRRMHFACGRVPESSLSSIHHWGPADGLWQPACKVPSPLWVLPVSTHCVIPLWE